MHRIAVLLYLASRTTGFAQHLAQCVDVMMMMMISSLSQLRYVHKSHDTSKCFKASAVVHSFGQILSNGWQFDRAAVVPNCGSIVLKVM